MIDSFFGLIIGLISGIFLGLILRYMTKNQYCHGPNSKDIVNTVFYDKKNDTYYRFTPVVTASVKIKN